MDEVSSLTIKINPKHGTFDAAASGESALLALVVIAADTVNLTLLLVLCRVSARSGLRIINDLDVLGES
ncbi:hypothetical protein BB934_40765 (plasmid) [Microvirga ossetica]|uniref:Uncharacterized protein n=1 Tax=Microvirga ossetica TaxID=1882682 RepID=A0A1B2EX44_9HYPH|nr:hypothetical protein [Microvirga ossetica]ANY84523.1 hypothetical protein BB934_40765 [Microvirga ossetica]